MSQKMSLKEFNENYEIDRTKSGVKAIPKLKSKVKSHKYKAEATERIIDGETVKFPSKKEALTYDKLALMVRAGRIKDLVVNAQMRGEDKIKYVFQTEPFKMWYEPDFEYFDLDSNEKVTADAKGVKTPEYKRKARLMIKMFGIEVLEY